MSQQKQEWGSRLGVILAVAGSAVGLGNFLRFPGNAAENGGGAFMIPYFLALLLLGIPIGWAEWAMGRYGGRKGFHCAPAIMGVWARGSVGRYLGVLGVLVPLAVYYYYVLIEAWCLDYCFDYVRMLGGGAGNGIHATMPIAQQVTASATRFNAATGVDANGILFGNSSAMLFCLVTIAINVWFVFRGLSKGIEFVCKWAMPTMGIIGLIVLARVLTFGTPDAAQPDNNVMNGLGFMWNPRFDKLWDFQTWMAAAGQIFFSLSVGFGVIINYASYMKRKDDVLLSGLTASATNEFFEVALGGLITLTAAVAFLGITVTSQGADSTFSLGFKTLPIVFAQMPAGNLFGALWFFMLFLAAITSSLSMLQPTQAFFEETLGVSRGKATALVTVVSLIGNVFVIYFSKGLTALDTIDFWVGSFFILVMAAVQIICFGWIFGAKRGYEEAHEGAQLQLRGWFGGLVIFITKFVTPIYLLVIIVGFCVQKVPAYVTKIIGDSAKNLPADKTALLTWGVILATIVLLVVCTAIGARRWRAQGLDLDGTRPPDDELPAAHKPAMTSR